MSTIWVTFEFGTMMSGHTLRACMAVVKFFTLQAQAIAGSRGRQPACYPEILRISYNFVQDNICIGQIMKTRFWQKLWTAVKCKEKNWGNMDLLIWLTSELLDWSEGRVMPQSTWSSVPLALQSNWSACVYQNMYKSYISSWKRGTTKCKFSAWKVIIQEMERRFGSHEREKSSTVICNIGLQLKENQTARSKVWLSLLNSKLISWVSYITTKLRTEDWRLTTSIISLRST